MPKGVYDHKHVGWRRTPAWTESMARRRVTWTPELLLSFCEPIPFSGCFIWMRGVGRNNKYPVIGKNGPQDAGHRLIWALTNGVIPKGLCVLHKCDVPQCLNPKHLYVGTHADNMHDKAIRGRARNGASKGGI